MDKFFQSFFTSIFLVLLWTSLDALLFSFRRALSYLFEGSCAYQIDVLLKVYEKMRSPTDAIKYTFSAWSSTVDKRRSLIPKDKRANVKVQDKRDTSHPKKCAILSLGVIAIAIMIAQLFAAAGMIYLLVPTPKVNSINLTDMNLITVGDGRELELDGKDRECFFYGVLLDKGTRTERNTVRRQDVRLDTLGIFMNMHLASTMADNSLKVWGVLKEDGKDLDLMLANQEMFGIGIKMRATVTGVDGTAMQYHLYGNNWEHNPELEHLLERLAKMAGIGIKGSVQYQFSQYWAELDAPFSRLLPVIIKIAEYKCRMLRVGKIHNSTDTSIIIPVAQTTLEELPPWFWYVFGLMALIAVISSGVSMTEFDDTEKLIILSRDIRASTKKGGELNSLAAPITGLSEEVRLGFSTIDGSHYRYGHLVERKQVPEGDVTGTIGGRVEGVADHEQDQAHRAPQADLDEAGTKAPMEDNFKSTPERALASNRVDEVSTSSDDSFCTTRTRVERSHLALDINEIDKSASDMVTSIPPRHSRLQSAPY